MSVYGEISSFKCIYILVYWSVYCNSNENCSIQWDYLPFDWMHGCECVCIFVWHVSDPIHCTCMWIECLADRMTKHSVQTFRYLWFSFFVSHFLFVYVFRLLVEFIHCGFNGNVTSMKRIRKIGFFSVFSKNFKLKKNVFKFQLNRNFQSRSNRVKFLIQRKTGSLPKHL